MIGDNDNALLINELIEGDFITRATRAIIIKGTIYNPNTDLFYFIEKVDYLF